MQSLFKALHLSLAILLTAASADAASVDIIWQNSGTGTTTAGWNEVLVADIVITVGIDDTPLVGAGAGVELSADVVSPEVANTVILSATQSTAGTGWLELPIGPAGSKHYENVVAQGDLLGGGEGVPAGASVILGTITINTGQALCCQIVTLGASGIGDAILGTGGVAVLDEYTFGGGYITPEPSTATLFGGGLLALGLWRRRSPAGANSATGTRS